MNRPALGFLDHCHRHPGRRPGNDHLGSRKGWNLPATDDPADRALPADRGNLDRAAVVKINHHRDHCRADREERMGYFGPATQNRHAQIEIDHFQSGFQRLAKVVGECRQQAIAGEGIADGGRGIADFRHKRRFSLTGNGRPMIDQPNRFMP
jgi:hypothetical protein